MIWVRPDLAARFGTLRFEDFLALGERTVKQSPDGRRRTAAFARGGGTFYVKAHLGVGWSEILRTWLQGKRPVVDARTEVRALERCAELAIPAPRLAAWGVSGASPATRRSFVVTEELARSRRLSEVVTAEGGPAEGGAGKGGARIRWRRRRELARALGRLVARFHRSGLVHRDLNLDHVFEREAGGAPELVLLDLHRAARVATRFERWRTKDLASLHASARRLGGTRTDAAAFLATYCAEVGADARALWRRAGRRAAQEARITSSSAGSSME